jgi:hypothetical protein
LVVGFDEEVEWDAPWRRQLVENLAVLVDHLWRVGIREIFIDGSFVENAPRPNDIDGYFVCDEEFWFSGRLTAELQKLDPAWNWRQRFPSPDSADSKIAIWHKYRVELFPDFGQPSGIPNQFGDDQAFAEAFRQSRRFKPKGIIQIGVTP